MVDWLIDRSTDPDATQHQTRHDEQTNQVDLSGAAYKTLLERRRDWGLHDLYENAGPLQFEGKTADDRCVRVCVRASGWCVEVDV